MDDEEREFEKRKMKLILTTMQWVFENENIDYFKEQKWKSAKELDEWVDKRLREYDEASKAVKDYFNEKIYS